MNENVQNRLEEVEQNTRGPGRMLREARKMQQLDLEAVSTRLNLDRRVVDAIDNDDFEHMPPATFIKGYLRAYAREVGLDPDEVVAEYDRVNLQPSDALTLKSRHNVQHQADLNDSPMRWISIGLVLILIALVAAWMLRDAGQESASDDASQAHEQAASVEPMAADMPTEGDLAAPEQTKAPGALAEEHTESPADMASTAESEPTEAVDQNTSGPAPTPGQTQPASVGEAEVEPEPVASASEALPGAQTDASTPQTPDPSALDTVENDTAGEQPATVDEQAAVTAQDAVLTETSSDGAVLDPEAPLIMSFTDDCWTSVQAVDGERLVYRVVKKGVILSIHGEAPFKITIGNSDAVKIVYQGKLFDHQPYSRGKIARFVLNADGTAR